MRKLQVCRYLRNADHLWAKHQNLAMSYVQLLPSIQDWNIISLSHTYWGKLYHWVTCNCGNLIMLYCIVLISRVLTIFVQLLKWLTSTDNKCEPTRSSCPHQIGNDLLKIINNILHKSKCSLQSRPNPNLPVGEMMYLRRLSRINSFDSFL